MPVGTIGGSLTTASTEVPSALTSNWRYRLIEYAAAGGRVLRAPSLIVPRPARGRVATAWSRARWTRCGAVPPDLDHESDLTAVPTSISARLLSEFRFEAGNTALCSRSGGAEPHMTPGVARTYI